jgi:exonuclease III
MYKIVMKLYSTPLGNRYFQGVGPLIANSDITVQIHPNGIPSIQAEHPPFRMNPFIFYAAFQLSWLDGDIVCLQEVDPLYFPYLLAELDSLGYHGVYKQHDSIHGVATFYKRAKFYMKSSDVYGFAELLGELGDAENQLKDANRHNQRYALYTTLQDLQSGKEVVIGWSCLKFNTQTEVEKMFRSLGTCFDGLKLCSIYKYFMKAMNKNSCPVHRRRNLQIHEQNIAGLKLVRINLVFSG